MSAARQTAPSELSGFLRRLLAVPTVGALSAADRAEAVVIVSEHGGGYACDDDTPTWFVQDCLDPWTGPTYWWDKSSVGEVAPSLRPASNAAELAASGRFAASPGRSQPNPAAVARTVRVVASGRLAPGASPSVDQLEAGSRLAESCSPGWERVRAVGRGRSLGSYLRPGHGPRKPQGDVRQDAAEQAGNPLSTPTIFVCDGVSLVYTRAGLVEAAQRCLPSDLKQREVCSFCHYLFNRTTRLPASAAMLLLGRGFWVSGQRTCGTCQEELDQNAAQRGVELTWVWQ